MEIPLLNSSASSLSPKQLTSLAKREKSADTQSTSGSEQQSRNIYTSSHQHSEIEEQKEPPVVKKKAALPTIQDIELQDIKLTSFSAEESRREQYTPAESLHLLEVTQRHLKTCTLIFQTAFALVIIAMILVGVSCAMTGTISYQIGITFAFSLFSAVLLRCTYSEIKSRFPSESSNQSSRIIISLIIKVLFSIYLIGAAGAAKVEIDVITIVNSFSSEEGMSQVGRIMMQDLMTTLLAYLVLLGLFIFFSFLLLILLILSIFHLLVAVFTCFKYSILGYFAKYFTKIWRKVLNRRLAALQQYRTVQRENINHEAQEQPCQICLEKFEIDQTIYRLPCETVHSFHEECLEKWAARSNICPSCRKPFSEL